ncbi:MAG TPA: hypothetical protein PLZ10_13425, partial [Chitinophagaceae bacterium]|nr:hypothetical protein [Chitinophagaceae bacterium]
MAVRGDSTCLDTLSIIPGSVQIKDIIAADYRIDLVNAILIWNRKPATDSIQISYRVFPFKLNAVTSRMAYDSVKTKFYVTPFEFNDGSGNAQRGIFDFGTLKAEGSFGRQVGFG